MRLLLTAIVVAVVVGWGFQIPLLDTAAYPGPEQPYKLNLPLIMRSHSGGLLPTPTATVPALPTATPTLSWPTSTPTRTATPSPTATTISCNGSAQALQNPSFENGWTSWVTVGIPERTTNAYTDGLWSIWLGGYNNSTDTIAQAAMVPNWAETAAIYVDWLMYSDDAALYNFNDELLMAIYDAPVNQQLAATRVWNTDTRGVWKTRRLELPNASAYRGRILSVVVGGYTDAFYLTTWFVDNIRFVFGCGSTIAGAETEPPLDGTAVPSASQIFRTQ